MKKLEDAYTAIEASDNERDAEIEKLQQKYRDYGIQLTSKILFSEDW